MLDRNHQETPSPRGPEIVHLQITERCNLACPKCYIPELNTTSAAQEATPERLRAELFEPAARAGASKLVITGGEPYLSRQLYDITAAARPFFQEIFIGTSGYFLDDEHCYKTLDAGIDFVQVSLDAVKPELLRQLTGIRQVERLWENCARLVRIRNERGAATQVVVATVIGPENAHEVLGVLDRCESIGVDSVTVQAYHEYPVVYRKERVDWPEFTRYDETFLGHVREVIAYILAEKERGSRSFPHTPVYFENLLRFFEDRAALDVPCSADDFLFVDSRGQIRGCLFSEPLGRLGDGIEAYLRSEERAKFNAFLADCHLCTHGCAYRPPMDP